MSPEPPRPPAGPDRMTTGRRSSGDFLAWVGGADNSILDSVPEEERARIRGLGITILMTPGIAISTMFIGLSSGLQLPAIVSVPATAVWGVINFLSDRYLAISLPRTRTFRRILYLAPFRIALALLTGLPTATAAVLGIFANEINTKSHKTDIARLQALYHLSSQSSVTAAAYVLLFSLFFATSLLPFIVKVLLNFGPVSQYDIAVKRKAEEGLPERSLLTDVLRLDPTDPAAIGRSWEADGSPARAVIGESAQGPFDIDLRRDGPHALIAGATGAGKSELLRTIVASLAVANRPDALAFMFVDYKGGTAYKDFASLPHTVGLITDLDVHLMNRVLQSLNAEVAHREFAMRAAAVPDFDAYVARRFRRARAGGSGGPGGPESLEQLPRLLVIVDEFAAQTLEFPDFLPSLMSIARRGRSLGMHLILATQHPEITISADVQATVNLRIALRMSDSEDSVAVIGADNAAYIKKDTPGRAYVRIGARQPLPIQVSTTGPDLPAIVAAINQANRIVGIPPQRRVWLPPLPEVLLLSDISPGGEPSIGSLVPVPYGLSDFPAEQDQRPAAIDFSSFTHMLAVGAPRSGLTQLLRTLAGSIAATHSTADVHMYVMDGCIFLTDVNVSQFGLKRLVSRESRLFGG